jgi:hypothetical protein
MFVGRRRNILEVSEARKGKRQLTTFKKIAGSKK